MFDIVPFRRHKSLQPAVEEFFSAQFPDFAKNPFGLEQVRSFAVDIQENGDSYLLQAELPGIDKDNITVEITDDYLTLMVKSDSATEQHEGNYLRKERRRFQTQRRFYIGDVDQEKITAQYDNGVLEISLPKRQGTTRRRSIDIH